MKEQVTIRLYQTADAPAAPHAGPYRPVEDVLGWDYAEGDQIGLYDTGGGYLMGLIDHIDPALCHDDAGCYRVATLWTQD